MEKEQARKYIKGRRLEIMCELELPQKKKWKDRLAEEFNFLRYVNNVLDFVDDECDEFPEDTIFEHKGYVLKQSGYNNHYMIFKEGKMICHAQCTEKLDQKGAEENIDCFINLINGKIKPKENDNERM